jgi:hypothetical protein
MMQTTQRCIITCVNWSIKDNSQAAWRCVSPKSKEAQTAQAVARRRLHPRSICVQPGHASLYNSSRLTTARGAALLAVGEQGHDNRYFPSAGGSVARSGFEQFAARSGAHAPPFHSLARLGRARRPSRKHFAIPRRTTRLVAAATSSCPSSGGCSANLRQLTDSCYSGFQRQ